MLKAVVPKEKDVSMNDLIKRYQPWHLRQQAGVNRAGVADYHFLLNGYFIAVELKRNAKKSGVKGRIAYNQKKEMMDVTDNGGVGVFASDPAFVERVFQACLHDDESLLFEMGWRTHGELELNDESFLEDCVW